MKESIPQQADVDPSVSCIIYIIHWLVQSAIRDVIPYLKFIGDRAPWRGTKSILDAIVLYVAVSTINPARTC